MPASKTLPQEAEIVIIGGGIIGCSVAYHLTLLGYKDVHLLERRELTCGTTWHAAGLVGQLRATSNLTKMAQYTSDLYRDLETTTEYSTGFKQNGSLSCAASEGRWTELLRGASMAQNLGLECEIYMPDEAKEKWPILDTKDLFGTLFLPSDGQTNPIDTTRAMASVARENGATIHEGVTVNRILHEGDKATGVSTDNGDIKARIVVLCGGMWSRDIAAACGVSLPLHAAEHFYIVTEGIDELPSDMPVIRDPDHCIYIKEDAGKLLVGAFEPVAKPWGHKGIAEDFCFDELPPDLDHFEPFLMNAMKRIPLLEKAGIRTFFNGPESFTPDDRYLLGETPNMSQLFVATGFNSIGIQSAGGAGKVLADWIDKGHPPMDLWDVDVRRVMPFQNNRQYLYDRTVESLGLLYQMHWPFRQPETARNVRKSVLHDRLTAAGACFGEQSGWERPNWYAPEGVKPEYEYSYGRQNWYDHSASEMKSVRENVGLFDQSSFAKFQLQGRDAEKILNRLSTSNMSVPVGKVVYTQWLNEKGGIESDLTITRLTDDSYLIVTAGASQTRDLNWLNRHIGSDDHAIATDVTSAYAVLGIMGPKSRDLLAFLTSEDMSHEAFPFGTSREIDLAYAKVRATRITYVGELGWELYIPTEFAQNVYDALIAAGDDFGLKHAGYHAMDSLRIEKAYRHWGHDLTDEDTPLEAGLAFTIDWNKPGGFIGQEALIRQKEGGIRKRIAIFKLDNPDTILFHDEPIWRDGKRVGNISSAAYGHTLGASIGLGYVNFEGPFDKDALLASTYEIEVAGVRVPSSISLSPLYDPKNLTIRQ